MKKFLGSIFFVLAFSVSALAAPIPQNYLIAADPGSGTNRNKASIAYDNGTNIGIGSTSPGTKLDVNGTVRATAFSGPLTGNVTGTATGNQPLDSDLTIYAGITPAANTQSLLGAADYAAMKVLLALTIGTNVQAFDADLTDLADGTLTASKVAQQMSITNDASGLKLSGDATTPGASKYYGTDSGGAKGYFTLPAGSGTINSGVSGYYSYYTASTTLDDSPVLYTDGTNVGIGTSVPGATLDVNGTIKAGTTTTGQVTAATGIGFDTNNDATNDVTFLTGGNVGLGSTNPANKLDVVGTIKATTDVKIGSNSLCQSDGTNCPAGSSGWTDGGTNVYNTTASDNVAIGTTLTSAGKLTIMGAGTTTGVGLQIQNSAGTALVTTLDSGNIGIGTTNPLSPFHIYNSTTSQLNVTNPGAQGATLGGGTKLVADSGAAMTAGNRLGALFFSGARDASHTINNSNAINGFADETWTGSTTASYMTFDTCPTGTVTRTEKMRITAAGNVGIGTTVPSDTLQVLGGSIRAAGYKSSDGTAGATVTTCTAFKNGLCISGT